MNRIIQILEGAAILLVLGTALAFRVVELDHLPGAERALAELDHLARGEVLEVEQRRISHGAGTTHGRRG